MVKKSKLLSALDRQQGRDYDAEKRKKQVKTAEKRKRQKEQKDDVDDEKNEEETPQLVNGSDSKSNSIKPTANNTIDEFEAFPEDDESASSDADGQDDTIPQPILNGDSDASASEAEQESDVDYSDLSEEDKEDVVPHQRMTINNGAALVASRKRVAVVSDKPKHPFHYHNSLVSDDKPASELVPDAMDDETRELMFYKIARDAALTARTLLKKEKIPFSRPPDYFAEMVKTDEHMGRIKKKMTDEASRKKAAEEARRLRDAKKFGKQVQVAREQEKSKEKRDTLDKIKELKRKRKGTDTGRTVEGDDLFEEINVESDAAGKRQKRDHEGGGRGGRGGRDGASKRQSKDSKFGFGGKKKYSKSGTTESSADMSGFSARRMKGSASGRGGRGGSRGGARGGSRGGARGGAKRLGKSRRPARG